ncbi:S-adenosyl-L-methionine-dependent methyltransferase [Morchella snyderi]|nr:S-adenosyl-L-methionine-dependent methyltransferase [Morchella snyderi]
MYVYAVKHLLYAPQEPVPRPPSLPGPSSAPAAVAVVPSSSRQQPLSSQQQPSRILRRKSSSSLLLLQPSSSKQRPQREVEIDEMSMPDLAKIEVDYSFDYKDTMETEDDSLQQSCEFSTESLTASIYEYRYENGRRYHAYKEGKYILPNDEAEQDRLDILHHAYLILMDDQLTFAPVVGPDLRRILDVGTGTGIWAIDMGERYPSAEVIGTDLSPIQPSWVPPNVHFQIDDAECEWTFPKNTFDLVHMRHLTGAIKDWENLYTEAYKHCKPGGWLDIAEYEMDIFCDDGTLPAGAEIKKFYDLISEATAATGREFHIAANLLPIIEKVGFVNAHHRMAKTPLGPWAADKKQKEVGAYLLLSAETGFEAFGIRLFTQVLGMSAEEAGALFKAAQKQAANRKIHVYGRHHFYYAQKPLDAES